MKYCLLMLIALTAVQAQANSAEADNRRSAWLMADVSKNARLSLNDATELVQKRTGGRVLAAQEVREQGRAMYRIKVLTRQGEVRIVFVDVETGSIE